MVIKLILLVHTSTNMCRCTFIKPNICFIYFFHPVDVDFICVVHTYVCMGDEVSRSLVNKSNGRRRVKSYFSAPK